MAIRADRLLIWGAGGHGKVVADLARSCGIDVVGLVDRDPAKQGRVVEPGGARVVVSEAQLTELRLAGTALPEGATAVVIAVGDNEARQQAAASVGEWLSEALVHPVAVVSPSAALGPGTVVFATVVVNAGATVGAGAILNSGAIVEHDCMVGEFTHISPGAVLAGGATVGNGTWVGAGAVILEGRKVGPRCLVGAGAVVVKDVPADTIVAGVPARRLR